MSIAADTPPTPENNTPSTDGQNLPEPNADVSTPPEGSIQNAVNPFTPEKVEVPPGELAPMPETDEIDFSESAEHEEPAQEDKPTNFVQEAAWSSHGDTSFNPENDTAFMPPDTLEHTRAKLTDLPNSRLSSSPAAQDWFNIVQGGLTAIPYSDGLKGTAARATATWRQTVPSNVGPLRAGVPPYKSKSGEKPSGESARFHIRSLMNMGTVFVAPLWHSGFWVTIKAPAERDLLELYRQINADKISLGRSTYGFIFSNGTSYTARAMMDFIVEHIHETSLALPDGGDIREFIRLPDLQTLIWALACACWPAGFQYQRSCVQNPEKCNYVLKERLNLSKLLWADTSAFTEWQTTHMTKRTRNSVTVEQVKRYVDEFVRGQDRLIEINDKVSVVMRVPSVTDHINAGFRWINTIEEMYARVLIQDEQERDDYLVKQGKATAMRQYAHLVKSINAEGMDYDDQETIEQTLDDLTSSDTTRTLFLTRAREYIENSLVAMIAIPTFTCPVCGNDHKSAAHKKHQELIALDAQQTFFQLLVQKLQKIENR